MDRETQDRLLGGWESRRGSGGRSPRREGTGDRVLLAEIFRRRLEKMEEEEEEVGASLPDNDGSRRVRSTPSAGTAGAAAEASGQLECKGPAEAPPPPLRIVAISDTHGLEDHLTAEGAPAPWYLTDGDGGGDGSGGDGGYADFDIIVDTPGTYTLEIRYAALDSRSIGVKLDDQMIADNILGKVTGSWFPDRQTWVAEVELELTQGQHVLKLDSPKVYPHIDKLALVLQPETDVWPFDTPAPPSLTTAGREHNVNPSFLSSWLWYFGSLTEAKLQTNPFLETWLAFANQLDCSSYQYGVIFKLNRACVLGNLIF